MKNRTMHGMTARWRGPRGVIRRAIVAAWCFGVLGALVVSPLRAEDALPSSGPEFGLWLSEDRGGVFRIGRCGKALCGTLIGLDYKATEPPPTGKDGILKCNLVMLTDFRPLADQKGRWEGRILDPDSGKVYHSQIWSPHDGILKLRGYVGIPLFGETQTWTRYNGPPMEPGCRMNTP